MSVTLDEKTLDTIIAKLDEASSIVSSMTALLAGTDMDVTMWNSTPLGILQRRLSDIGELLLVEEGEEGE